MRLLVLLHVLGLVLVGESLKTLYGPPPARRIFFILSPPSYYNRVRAAQRGMMQNGGHGMQPLGLGGRRPTIGNTHTASLVPSRAPTTAPFLPPQDQSNRPSQHDQRLSPSNPGHSPRPSLPNQGHDVTGFGGGFQSPALRDNVFVPDSEPAVSDQQDKRTGFVKGFKTPSISDNPFSSSLDHKPSSEEGNKPSNSDEDQKSSSFDKTKITQLFDTLPPHPDRSPVCTVLPNPGTCRAALPRYYLDPETGTCNCYLYGGCTEDGTGESPSSFFTLEECQRTCHPPNMKEGPTCKEIFREDEFESFLVEPQQTKNTKTDHLSDKEFLESFFK